MYAGDANLRGLREEVPITRDQIEEMIRCKEDIIHFAANYFYIVTQDDGQIKIKLRDYQKKILKTYITPPNNKRHVLLAQPRQSGKCFCQQHLLTVRDKTTGEVSSVTVNDLLNDGNPGTVLEK